MQRAFQELYVQLESANDFIKLQSAVIDILVRNLKGVSRKYVGPYLAKKLLKEWAGDRTYKGVGRYVCRLEHFPSLRAFWRPCTCAGSVSA